MGGCGGMGGCCGWVVGVGWVCVWLGGIKTMANLKALGLASFWFNLTCTLIYRTNLIDLYSTHQFKCNICWLN